VSGLEFVGKLSKNPVVSASKKIYYNSWENFKNWCGVSVSGVRIKIRGKTLKTGVVSVSVVSG
jgi:hypothetical protein